MKKLQLLLLTLLIPFLGYTQNNSWVRFQVQFDFYAPQESNFFMVSNGYGDTSIFFQPTSQYEYLDTVIDINSGNYTISLRDSFGDGWVSNQPASFKMGNTCQGDIIDWSPVIGSFFQRDTTVTIYPCPPPPPPVCIPSLLHINLDQFPLETSWEIKDSTGAVIESGGPYSYMVNYQSFSVPICLPVGSMEFTMMDSYGDGVAGSLWGGQDGSYYLIQCNDTVVFGDVANFGNDTIHTFVSDSCPPIYGCMDTSYIEFNPIADTDTGSCLNLVVIGCIDSTMYNYDPLANRMDLISNCDYTLTLYDLMGDGWVGSYLRVIQGADTNIFILTTGFSQDFIINLNAPGQVRFKFFVTIQAQLTAAHCGFKLTNPLGDVMIEVAAPFIQPLFNYTTIPYCGNLCINKVFGCLDPLAINYDTLVNTDDGSCYYIPGCVNSSYLEYYTQGFTADFDDGSCYIQVVWGCIDSTAFNFNLLANIDNGGCLPVIMGCMQPLAFNYNAQANTSDTCIAILYGCTDSTALNYNLLANTNVGCISFVYGCTDATSFNFNPAANTSDNSCIPVVIGCTDPSALNFDILANTNSGCIYPFLGCIDPTAFNFNINANTDDGSCIPFIYGCTNNLATNYNPTANTDNGSCILPLLGCIDQTMFNYDPLANTDDGSCIPFIYGCMDNTAFNFNTLANTDNGSCIAVVNGCTDSLAFNYMSSANTDNGSCIPFIYGCTDNTALNFDPLSNTLDNSCCYIGGCTDPTALNYNSLACFDDNSCIVTIVGCTDVAAWNYDPTANVSDSTACLFDAGCYGGPGVPYWLNDPCYAWVIDTDNNCCTDDWDNYCVELYNYCQEGMPTNIEELLRENDFVIYPNPTKDIINLAYNKNAKIDLYGPLGDLMASGDNIKQIDLSAYSNGIYVLYISYDNKIITHKIIKQ